MDYSSRPFVRAVAIRAVRDAFMHSDLTLPSDVIDVIVLHLRDDYVVVHKAAVDFFRFGYTPLNQQQHEEAFTALFHIWNYYAKIPLERFFMDDIAQVR